MSVEIIRAYHGNGQLRCEIPTVNGRNHGLKRDWHPNGVLASEIPFVDGLEHGTAKVWASDGQLLGEYQMEHGTGMVTIWRADGTISSEGTMLKGEPTGRMRCWENGELIVEGYWLNGRKVSRKKYLEACKADPSLPKDW